MAADDHISSYLATYPTVLHSTATELLLHRQVFWNPFELRNHEAGLNVWELHEKIKYAFCNVNWCLPSNGIILQFWAPETTDGRLLLSTSNQPFALVYLNTGLRKYRSSSVNHRYSMELEAKDEKIISGPVATAFQNRCPQVVVLDVGTIQQQNLLAESALKSDLTCSLFLPVFSQSPPFSDSCVGVV